MKKLFITLSILAFILSGCNRRMPAGEFYDRMFGWRITIPEGFDKESSRSLERNTENSRQMFENTFGEKIEATPMQILSLISREGGFNRISALYAGYFNPLLHGCFSENVRNVNVITYEMLSTQWQGWTFDTLTTIEQIDGFDFYVLKVKATNQDDILNVLSYRRLFGTKMFTFSISYTNEEIGQQILDAWRNSTFGR